MSSTNGTGMSAPSVNNGYELLRYNNMHMLHPAEQTKVRVGTLLFEISFPARGQYQRQYERNWQGFSENYRNAVPNMKSLGIQPQIEITEFVQHRLGRRNAYRLYDEIGRGEYGMVCKASDSRTGELYAAKKFTTRQPGWDAKAYMEIAISQDVTHEHIVSFVDSIDDGGEPVLVMEYVPLGNLTGLQGISLEEMRIVLRQALQALAYLHDEKNITHRDIKPENILVQSTTPELFIKLCDFGLSTRSSFLKTHCGTGLYAAAEIFTGSYTKSVDIWAMGVLGYQFIKGLPTPPENLNFRKWPKRWSKEWSQKIRRAIDHPSCQSNDSAVPLLKSMLEPNPVDRPSAKACLLDPWIQSALPFSQPSLEQTNVQLRSPETISEQSTEIWNPSMQNEMPDPIVPGRLRKRVRSSESITSGVQPLKRGVKNPQVDISLERNVRGLLADGPYVQDREGGPRKSLGRTSRGRHFGNLPPDLAGKTFPRVQITAGQTGRTQATSSESNEAIAVITNIDSKYAQMKIEDQIVSLRKEDCFLNATQITMAAKVTKLERDRLLKRMKIHTKVEVNDPVSGSWVNLQHARILCKHLNLDRRLRPLLDYAQKFQKNSVEMAIGEDQDYFLANNPVNRKYIAVPVHPKPVMVRKQDCRVNAYQILRVVGGRNTYELQKIKIDHGREFDIVHGDSRYSGTYVDFDIAMNICRKHGLVELASQIRQACLDEQVLEKTLPSEGIDVEVQPRDAAGQTGEPFRPDSGLPQEWRHSQRTESRSQSDSSDPEDDIREEDLGEEHPISDAASESSISSSETSTERESEPSSVRLRVKAAPIHQHTQYSLTETGPQSSPARSSHDLSWASQSQHSQLLIFKPVLKPLSSITSPYEIFTGTTSSAWCCAQTGGDDADGFD